MEGKGRWCDTLESFYMSYSGVKHNMEVSVSDTDSYVEEYQNLFLIFQNYHGDNKGLILLPVISKSLRADPIKWEYSPGP